MAADPEDQKDALAGNPAVLAPIGEKFTRYGDSISGINQLGSRPRNLSYLNNAFHFWGFTDTNVFAIPHLSAKGSTRPARCTPVVGAGHPYRSLHLFESNLRAPAPDE